MKWLKAQEDNKVPQNIEINSYWGPKSRNVVWRIDNIDDTADYVTLVREDKDKKEKDSEKYKKTVQTDKLFRFYERIQ